MLRYNGFLLLLSADIRKCVFAALLDLAFEIQLIFCVPWLYVLSFQERPQAHSIRPQAPKTQVYFLSSSLLCLLACYLLVCLCSCLLARPACYMSVLILLYCVFI